MRALLLAEERGRGADTDRGEPTVVDRVAARRRRARVTEPNPPRPGQRPRRQRADEIRRAIHQEDGDQVVEPGARLGEADEPVEPGAPRPPRAGPGGRRPGA